MKTPNNLKIRKNHLLRSHETIMDFAFRKGVYTTSVYDAIKTGKIIPDTVGTSRVLMIDLRKYGSYRFQSRNPDKSAMIRWYLSVNYQVRGKKARRKMQILLHPILHLQNEPTMTRSNLHIRLSNGKSIVCVSESSSAPEHGYIVENLILPLLSLEDSEQELQLLRKHCTMNDRRFNAIYRYKINLIKKEVRLFEEKYSDKRETFRRGKEITERYDNYLNSIKGK